MSAKSSLHDGVKTLVEKSKGEIEAAVTAGYDGILIEEAGGNGFSDVLAALGGVLAASVDEAFRVHFGVGVQRVMVAFTDGRLMVVKPVGHKVLCVLTKPQPQLGFVLFLLDALSRNGQH